ncbi:unnamed protein product [Discula destructiva]
MADNMEAQVAVEVAAVAEVPEATPPESSQSLKAGDTGKADARVPPASGKRAIGEDDDADGDGKGQLEGSLRPRKKAKTAPAPTSTPATGNAVEEDITESADGDRDVSEGDGMGSIKSSSTDGKESPSAPDESSQQAAPSLAVAGLRTSFARPAASGPVGVRTSFGATSQAQSTKRSLEFEMHNPLTTDERNQLSAAFHNRDSPVLTRRRLNWAVGPIKQEYIVGNTWLEVWESTVDKWCEGFVSDNQENITKVGLAPSLLKTGFERRLEHCRSEDLPDLFKQITQTLLKNPDTSRLRHFGGAFKPDLEKLAKKQARKQAKLASETEGSTNTPTPMNVEGVLSGGHSTSVAPPVSEETADDVEEHSEEDTENAQNEAEMEDGEINSADASGVDLTMDDDVAPISQAELDQRHLYFPGIPDDATFCLTCAHLGHTTEDCPELICKFCQGAHFKYQCPTRQRCAKCKQLGHSKTACKEKLAMAPGEAAMECAICEGYDHTEMNCVQLYQIYRPQPGQVKRVKQIPLFCYACGAAGHCGGNCRMADSSFLPTKMWTVATASLYIDPTSDNIALSYQSVLAPPPEVLRPNIPGRSIKPQTHVVYEESDGEGDGGLLGPTGGRGRNKRGPNDNNKNNNNGKPNSAPTINIASNFTFGGATGPPRPPPPPPPQQQQQQGRSKRQKGPAQPQNKSKKPGNDALPGTKPNRPNPQKKSANPHQAPGNSSKANQGGRGGGNAGRGGENGGRRGRRRRGGRGQ